MRVPKSLRDKCMQLSLQLDGFSVSAKAVVKNLGVTIDSELSLQAHINNITRVAFFHLRNIPKLRTMLSLQDAEQMAHAFFTSRWD